MMICCSNFCFKINLRRYTVGAALDYTHAHAHPLGRGGGVGGLQALQPLQYPVGAYTRSLLSST